MQPDIRTNEHLFPFCIVWTPLPIISWLFPFIGHMGIATSRGIIRDFAGNYHVSENYMAFGWPTSYWELSPTKVPGGVSAYDKAIQQASDEYGNHTHNIFCDNCHSHVALALNTMQYDGRTNWNMVNLCVLMLVKGRHVGFGGFVKQYLPFFVWAVVFVTLCAYLVL